MDYSNRAKIIAVTSADPQLDNATRIAQQAVEGALPDSTNGATHYFEVT
jgi:hypothetical protein